jgi:hypothetical protein
VNGVSFVLQNIFGLPNLKSWVWHSNNFSFQMKWVKDDLMRLVHHLDTSDDDAFTEATGPIAPKRQVTYEAVPERVRTQGGVRMHKRSVPPGADDKPNRSRPLPPVPGSDLEELLDTEVEAATSSRPAAQALMVACCSGSHGGEAGPTFHRQTE